MPPRADDLRGWHTLEVSSTARMARWAGQALPSLVTRHSQEWDSGSRGESVRTHCKGTRLLDGTSHGTCAMCTQHRLGFHHRAAPDGGKLGAARPRVPPRASRWRGREVAVGARPQRPGLAQDHLHTPHEPAAPPCAPTLSGQAAATCGDQTLFPACPWFCLNCLNQEAVPGESGGDGGPPAEHSGGSKGPSSRWAGAKGTSLRARQGLEVLPGLGRVSRGPFEPGCGAEPGELEKSRGFLPSCLSPASKPCDS